MVSNYRLNSISLCCIFFLVRESCLEYGELVAEAAASIFVISNSQ